MVTGLNLLVLSTIAFVWFVAVIRRRVGDREERFFGTVFLSSALLLAGLWLVGAMVHTTPALAACVGYATGVFLMFVPVPSALLHWAFPAWVAMISALALMRSST